MCQNKWGQYDQSKPDNYGTQSHGLGVNAPKTQGITGLKSNSLSGGKKTKRLRISVAQKISINWDVGRIDIKDDTSLTGAGRFQENYLVCGNKHSKLSKPSVFNKKCKEKAPGNYIKKIPTLKNMKDLVGKEGKWFPDVGIKYNAAQNEWILYSVTSYCMLTINEPPEGAYPVFGKNVTINKSDGIRGGNPPQKKINAKGYYRDVAQNLLLYRGSDDKQVNYMYWWVKGSTERHEKNHLKYYKKMFNAKIKNHLLQTAGKLFIKFRNHKSVSKNELESEARLILKEYLENDTDLAKTTERVVSGLTALEFKKVAADLIKKGEALEKAQKNHKKP